MCDIIKTIEREGKENVRFLIPMHKIERSYDFGFMRVNSLSNKKELKECIITENPKETHYKIKENYKISLKSIEDGRIQHFYISDLNSLVHQGSIKMEVKPAFLD